MTYRELFAGKGPEVMNELNRRAQANLKTAQFGFLKALLWFVLFLIVVFILV